MLASEVSGNPKLEYLVVTRYRKFSLPDKEICMGSFLYSTKRCALKVLFTRGYANKQKSLLIGQTICTYIDISKEIILISPIHMPSLIQPTISLTHLQPNPTMKI